MEGLKGIRPIRWAKDSAAQEGPPDNNVATAGAFF